MQIASYEKAKTAPSDTPNKNGTQQKKQHLMPFENNGTPQKWHMTDTPPKINKWDTEKNGALQKWYTLRKNTQRLFDKGWTGWFLQGNS